MPWFGLVAQFSGDPERGEQRGAVRRRLHFESMLAGARDPAKAVVLNLSEAGLMLHTLDDLAVGEVFDLELPGAIAQARVVWKRVSLHGCEFVSPVSRAAISAILLKASPEPRRQNGLQKN